MSKAFAIEELDETDRELLRLLQADGTLSSAALGERLSMTVTPCWRRRKGWKSWASSRITRPTSTAGNWGTT